MFVVGTANEACVWGRPSKKARPLLRILHSRDLFLRGLREERRERRGASVRTGWAWARARARARTAGRGRRYRQLGPRQSADSSRAWTAPVGSLGRHFANGVREEARGGRPRGDGHRPRWAPSARRPETRPAERSPVLPAARGSGSGGRDCGSPSRRRTAAPGPLGPVCVFLFPGGRRHALFLLSHHFTAVRGKPARKTAFPAGLLALCFSGLLGAVLRRAPVLPPVAPPPFAPGKNSAEAFQRKPAAFLLRPRPRPPPGAAASSGPGACRHTSRPEDETPLLFRLGLSPPGATGLLLNNWPLWVSASTRWLSPRCFRFYGPSLVNPSVLPVDLAVENSEDGYGP